MSDRCQPASNKRTAIWLGVLVVAMFGFGFAMVPLYDLFCQVTGIQSIGARTTDSAFRTGTSNPAEGRYVTVKFDTTVNSELPWEFRPVVRKLRVRVGGTHQAMFRARNLTDAAITGQAIPSVAPWQATEYFHKVECFCFARQRLEAGASSEMPLRFSISPDLPEGISSLTLSYTFMKYNGPEQVPVHSAGTMATDPPIPEGG
jgi:cytochrome c oxidase assembly protein subunit 11